MRKVYMYQWLQFSHHNCTIQRSKDFSRDFCILSAFRVLVCRSNYSRFPLSSLSSHRNAAERLHNVEMSLYLWFSQKGLDVARILIFFWISSLSLSPRAHSFFSSFFGVSFYFVFDFHNIKSCQASAMRLSSIFSAANAKILQLKCTTTAWLCRRGSVNQATIPLSRESSRSEHIPSIWMCTTRTRCTTSLTTMECSTSPFSQEWRENEAFVIKKL